MKTVSPLGALIIVILISGLFSASVTYFGTASASTEGSDVPKPIVPEFTLTYVDHFYDVPPTYEIDEFTGEQVVKQEGYRVDNRSVVFKITNQPFVPYTDSDGNNIELYYNFRFKGSFGDEWKCYPFSESGISAYRYNFLMSPSASCPKLTASTSEYTDLKIKLTTLFGYEGLEYGDQVDFQVQAQTGYISPFGDGYYRFVGQSSDWSETQKITVGESQTPTPSPEATPATSPEPALTDQELLTGVAIVAVVIAAGLGLLLILIKRK